MKRFLTVLSVIICIVTFVSVASAGNINVEITSQKNFTDSVHVTFVISNDTGKYLDFCELSIILLNNGKIVGSHSRPIIDVPSGCFISKEYYFNGVTSFTHYRWSATRVELK